MQKDYALFKEEHRNISMKMYDLNFFSYRLINCVFIYQVTRVRSVRCPSSWCHCISTVTRCRSSRPADAPSSSEPSSPATSWPASLPRRITTSQKRRVSPQLFPHPLSIYSLLVFDQEVFCLSEATENHGWWCKTVTCPIWYFTIPRFILSQWMIHRVTAHKTSSSAELGKRTAERNYIVPVSHWQELHFWKTPK